MRHLWSSIVGSWGTKMKFSLPVYLWFLAMLASMAFLTKDKLGLYLVPPFLATLSILHFLPDSAIAQPYAVIVGSVAGAAIGTFMTIFGYGPLFAALGAALAFVVIHALHAYHPPGVALALYPALLHTHPMFPVRVVLPFAILAVGSAAFFSRLSSKWPKYPMPLREKPFAPPSTMN